MALHFGVDEHGLREHHKGMYTRIGWWVLAGAVLLRWVIGFLTEIPEVAIAVLVAFLAGAWSSTSSRKSCLRSARVASGPSRSAPLSTRRSCWCCNTELRKEKGPADRPQRRASRAFLYPPPKDGIIPGMTYAWIMASMPIATVRMSDHLRVRRKMSGSRPTWSIAEVATLKFCGEIIFPITPPEELVAPARAGSMPSCWAVTVCIGPKRLFAEVSEPVRTTPSHPIKAEKNGKRKPAAANARPNVKVAPE